MSTLANLITQHASAEAAAQDWPSVAATIRGLGLRQTPRLCYSVESGDAIEAAGDDPTTVIGAMLLDPNGTMLFQRLSSSAGVEWAHPRTQQWLAWFVSQGRISQAGANALINLSAPLLFADLTAEQCRTEYQRETLASEWASLQNDGGINTAVAAGDRTALKAALAAAIEVL